MFKLANFYHGPHLTTFDERSTLAARREQALTEYSFPETVLKGDRYRLRAFKKKKKNLARFGKATD